jgi:aminoglycoside phosphotransferase
MFDCDRFSGFIDVGNGGIGDRHIDLFWGAWTLQFNLKTDKYKDIFFDAYGRKNIDFDRFSLIAACEVFGKKGLRYGNHKGTAILPYSTYKSNSLRI